MTIASDTSLAEFLRTENRNAWDAMIGHRFVEDIRHDRLPVEVFRRYLVYERAFVETALAIFGYALVRAPDIAAKRMLVRVLHGLAFEQIDYFDRVFAELGIAVEVPSADQLPGRAAGLRDSVLGFAAHGEYGEVLVAMLAAEWMYETWCAAAAREAISLPALRHWVELHVGGGFGEQVAWLRQQVDELAPSVSAQRRNHLSYVFRRTLELEIEFHEAAYS